ncbi:MAG: hypothetical protein MZV49_18675 [Rhodopseudomonas palustris]|nr:hypothetical protein [Rhodopseudomonas palustris]
MREIAAIRLTAINVQLSGHDSIASPWHRLSGGPSETSGKSMTTTDSTASSSGNYDSVAIALHWIIALFIIALVTSAQIAGGMEGPQRGDDSGLA